MPTSLRVIFAALLAASVVTVNAQTFPSKPVRIIIPFPPGAGPDIVARTAGVALTGRWAQQVLVDNRPGGGGNIATEIAAKAAPDGYTLLLASNHVTINPSLFKAVPYDPVRSFAPVTLAAVTPNILVVHPSLPVRSVKALIALARAKPGQLNFSSGGNGSVGHLAGEMFKTHARIDLVHVPYKGPVAAMSALLNGEASVGFLLVAAVLPQVKAGKLRALAVTSHKRSQAAPDLPTLDETGLSGYEIVAWQGLFAPAGTAPDIVRKIHLDMTAVLAMPDIRHALMLQGLETVASTSEDFVAYIQNDIAKWARVVRDAHVRVD